MVPVVGDGDIPEALYGIQAIGASPDDFEKTHTLANGAKLSLKCLPEQIDDKAESMHPWYHGEPLAHAFGVFLTGDHHDALVPFVHSCFDDAILFVQSFGKLDVRPLNEDYGHHKQSQMDQRYVQGVN
jgi:hypothetical protein